MSTSQEHLSLHQLIESGDTQKIELMVDSTVDIETPDSNWGMTPLELASELGNIHIVSLLLNNGASPNSISVASPLYLAAAKGYSEIVSTLINAGADVHFTHEDGLTPLFEAASRGHLKVVELLIEAGANPNSVDNYENKPISYAAQNGYIEIVEYLAAYASDDEQEAALKEAIEGAGAKVRKKRERKQARLNQCP